MKNKLLGLALICLIALAVNLHFQSSVSQASVNDGAAYTSTTTSSGVASSTKLWTLLSKGGIFGSVIIASSSPTTTYPSLVVYDANSTMATSTARVLAKFGGVNQTHGTYTFDSSFVYGISIEMPTGFNGAYTLTYK
jgi:hypothetical protein